MAGIKVLARGVLTIAALLAMFGAASLGVWQAINTGFTVGHRALD